MATLGDLWQLMATYGIFWLMMATFGKLLEFLATDGNFWKLLATNIFNWHIFPKLLAAYIQYKYIFCKTVYSPTLRLKGGQKLSNLHASLKCWHGISDTNRLSYTAKCAKIHSAESGLIRSQLLVIWEPTFSHQFDSKWYKPRWWWCTQCGPR